MLGKIISSFLFTIPLFSVCTSQSLKAQSIQDEYIDIAGNTLHLRIMRGEANQASLPTILLESGGGGDSSQWANIQLRLAEETGAVVVSYDRWGFGESDLPDTPYVLKNELSSIHDALSQLDLSDSVLLVGHSFGGLLIHGYAAFWPEQVKGMLFLDPNTPAAMLALKPFMTPEPSQTDTKEGQAFIRINDAINDIMTTLLLNPVPPDIPIIVISSDGLSWGERANKAFRLIHELLAVSVENGRHIIAEGSSHNIPGERPEIVITSVKNLLKLDGDE